MRFRTAVELDSRREPMAEDGYDAWWAQTAQWSDVGYQFHDQCDSDISREVAAELSKVKSQSYSSSGDGGVLHRICRSRTRVMSAAVLCT